MNDRRYISISLLLLFLLLGSGCSSAPDADQLRDETRLLTRNVLPIITEYHVEGYTLSDNCIAIGYRDGVFASRPDATICRSMFRSRPEFLSQQAQKDVQHIHAVVTNASPRVHTIRDVQFMYGEVTRAVFDCSGGWKRIYFVYEPDYVLPTAVPGETDYTVIDRNWYYKREDFN